MRSADGAGSLWRRAKRDPGPYRPGSCLGPLEQMLPQGSQAMKGSDPPRHGNNVDGPVVRKEDRRRTE